jgi:hypothetical protein
MKIDLIFLSLSIPTFSTIRAIQEMPKIYALRLHISNIFFFFFFFLKKIISSKFENPSSNFENPSQPKLEKTKTSLKGKMNLRLQF